MWGTNEKKNNNNHSNNNKKEKEKHEKAVPTSVFNSVNTSAGVMTWALARQTTIRTKRRACRKLLSLSDSRREEASRWTKGRK